MKAGVDIEVCNAEPCGEKMDEHLCEPWIRLAIDSGVGVACIAKLRGRQAEVMPRSLHVLTEERYHEGQ